MLTTNLGRYALVASQSPLRSRFSYLASFVFPERLESAAESLISLSSSSPSLSPDADEENAVVGLARTAMEVFNGKAKWPEVINAAKDDDEDEDYDEEDDEYEARMKSQSNSNNYNNKDDDDDDDE